MSTISRILFPTDFSLCSQHAEAFVRYLARVCHASVHVLHTLEVFAGVDMMTIQEADETAGRLNDTLNRLRDDGVPVTSEQHPGQPDVTIAEVATSQQVDFIVMGTHGRSGAERLALGSATEQVIAIAPCPLLMVREPVEPVRTAPSIRFQHVLVPVDFSTASLQGLEYGVQLAHDLQASLSLLLMTETEPADGKVVQINTPQDSAELGTKLASLAKRVRQYHPSVHEHISTGAAEEGILQFVETQSPDLIVMGTHGRLGLSRLLWGSTTVDVMHHTSCPVLAVRQLPTRFVSHVVMPARSHE